MEKDLIGFYVNRHEPSSLKDGEKLLCEYTGVGKVLEAALIYAWDEKDDSLKSETQKYR